MYKQTWCQRGWGRGEGQDLGLGAWLRLDLGGMCSLPEQDLVNVWEDPTLTDGHVLQELWIW